MHLPWGTWCSGITPAQHAGGPGFNPQCVHLYFPSADGMLRQTERELEDVSVLVTSNYETIFKQMQSKLVLW